jgi:sortase A
MRLLLARLLLAVGGGVLAYCGWQYAEQALTQRQLTEQLRRAHERAPRVETERAIARSAPFPWRVSIPRVGMSVAVVDGADESSLRVAAGRIPGTGVPGRPGTIGLAAHRDTFFRKLQEVRLGDDVVLETAGDEFTYRVVSTTIVDPDDTWVLQPGHEQVLVLVTCYPFVFVGHAPQRFVVRAVRTHQNSG